MKRLSRSAAAVAGGMLIVSLAAPVSAQDAKAIFDKNCSTCHGPAGKGDGPAGKMLKPPPADLGSVTKSMTDADVAKVITEGGKAVGKSAAMPGFKGKLTDDQIQGLVQYVKGFAGK